MKPMQVDIIILSKTDSAQKQKMTEECIESLLASENPTEIRFNVVIIESCATFGGYEARFGRTIEPGGKFGFNKFLNIGIRETHSEFVCLCNNDLIFHPGWASSLLAAMRAHPEIESCCPYCSIYHAAKGMEAGGPPVAGYYDEVLIGWCIFVKRTVLDRIGPLDEKITFWYAERDFGKLLEAAGIVHALVSTSRVDHLGSQSLQKCSQLEQFRLTNYQQLYFDYKWRHKSRLCYFWRWLCYWPTLLVKLAQNAKGSWVNRRRKDAPV
jgi:GT2 family glycosyltransferase